MACKACEERRRKLAAAARALAARSEAFKVKMFKSRKQKGK